MRSHTQAEPKAFPRTVICVAGGIGFPHGLAASRRMLLMGRAFQAGGVAYEVWHVGPSSNPANTVAASSVDGVPFRFVPGVPHIRWRILRWGMVALGMVALAFRLAGRRRRTMMYVWYGGGWLSVWTLLLGRLLGIPSIQEVNEWWPGTGYDTRWTRFVYRRVLFRYSHGALPISRTIEERIRSLVGLSYPCCRVPALIDPEEVGQLCQYPVVPATPPELLWCGAVDGYRRDVFFLVDVLGALGVGAGGGARLVVCGPCSKGTEAEIRTRARERNVAPDRVRITGYLSNADLCASLRRATALLLPLWDDDRSRTRFPTKLAQYASVGRPIVAADVGEIPAFLTHGETALLYAAGNVPACAACVARLVADPALSRRLASHTVAHVLPQFDYRTYATALAEFAERIVAEKSV